MENVLAAVAAARLLGVDDEAIAHGVASLAGVPGRFEKVDEGQAFTVIVDYSHKPNALANVLSPPAALHLGVSSASSVAAETATAASGQSWARSPPSSPIWRSSPRTTHEANTPE